MEERGFDALQNGLGPAILIMSTILLVAIIIAGGLFFRYKEMQWRAANEPKPPMGDDARNDPVG